MATSIDQKNFVKTALRIPPHLHAAVHEAAKKAGRSYNAELVQLIERALAFPDGFIAAPEHLSSFSSSDETGIQTRTGREVMIEMADLIRRASHLAEVFRSFQDGSVEQARAANISDPPEWSNLANPEDISDRESKPQRQRRSRSSGSKS